MSKSIDPNNTKYRLSRVITERASSLGLDGEDFKSDECKARFSFFFWGSSVFPSVKGPPRGEWDHYVATEIYQAFRTVFLFTMNQKL